MLKSQISNFEFDTTDASHYAYSQLLNKITDTLEKTDQKSKR